MQEQGASILTILFSIVVALFIGTPIVFSILGLFGQKNKDKTERAILMQHIISNFENASESQEEEAEITDEVYVKKDYPRKLVEFIGQSRTKEILEIGIMAAKEKGRPLRHTLFFGPPGLGKTTLAEIITSEMEARFIPIVGSSLRTVEDIARLVKEIRYGDILFIDEIHRLPTKISEEFYHVLENFEYLYYNKGERDLLEIPKFTTIGATTSFGLLPKPLRDRFKDQLELYPYSDEEIAQIIKILSSMSDSLCYQVAKRAQGTPRIAKSLLYHLEDYVLTLADKTEPSQQDLEYIFSLKGIDGMGLVPTQRKILRYLSGQEHPVGKMAMCTANNVDYEDLETLYEPWLLQKGLIVRTPRGRIITEEGLEHIDTGD